jgi:subtilisin family serine protease
MLAAAGVAVLAVMVSGLAAASAWAAAGQLDRDSRVQYEGNTGLVPRSGEWWFSEWEVQQRVWPLTEGAGVTVAVLDTGVQASVPDLRGVVLPGGDVTGHHSNGETDFNTVGFGHGTMMSVLIAGQGFGTGMAGIAPEAKILPVVVNATAADAGAAPAAIAAGIVYAVNHGAQVISIPQAGQTPSASGCPAQEQAAVARALSRNVVVVAAAGNISLTGTGPAAPASCAGVLAVSAVQQDGAVWPGGTRQPYVAVAAPGSDLVTSGRAGGLVTEVNGTRSASALVSGVAALIRSRYPSMPWYQVVRRLTGTALPAGGTVPNDSFGSGIVRPDRAVNATAFTVPASVPNPVYAKYQAWLATPAGRSVSRQLGGSASPPASASRPALAAPPAGNGGSGTRMVMIFVAVIVVLSCVAVALIAAWRRIRHNDDRSALFGPIGPAFPDHADVLGESSPYRNPSYRNSLPPEDPPYESTPFRTPPYGNPQYRNPLYQNPPVQNPPDPGRYPQP